MEQLFALLRLGLKTCTIEKENISDFIMMPADKWTNLGDKARNQGVLGFVLDGIECLEETPYGPTRELSKQQELEWIGQVMQLEQGNKNQMEVISDLALKWIDEGCKVMVMKGQANGLLYPKPFHRSPGDIAIYLRIIN